jgi:DNA-binding MarR family transcriptional regulator
MKKGSSHDIIVATTHRTMSTAEYQALAQFRYLIRRYLNNTEATVRALGLEPQQYMCMLAVRGLPQGQQATIRNVAERLQIRHHSVVELVDRMEKRGLLRRERSTEDRRQVLVRVTQKGEKLLSRLVRHRLAELRVEGPALTRALQAVVASSPHPGRARKQTQSGGSAVARTEG